MIASLFEEFDRTITEGKDVSVRGRTEWWDPLLWVKDCARSGTSSHQESLMANEKSNRQVTNGKNPRKGLHLILTVGHSTRARKKFIDLLRANGVKQLIDVRSIPRSRHNPQFNRAVLSRALRGAGIGYRHMAGLGGLRHSRRDSINTGWRNKSFRGYADYMQTSKFQIALQQLMAVATRKRVALMCAEAVPWRCHRSLIADALLIRGFPVEEIQSDTRTRPHSLTPWAHVEGTRITYPPVPATTKQHVLAGESVRKTKMIQLSRVYDKAARKMVSVSLSSGSGPVELKNPRCALTPG